MYISDMLESDIKAARLSVADNKEDSDYSLRVFVKKLSAKNVNYTKRQSAGCIGMGIGTLVGPLISVLFLVSHAPNIDVDDTLFDGYLLTGLAGGEALGMFLGVKSVPNAVKVEYQAYFKLYDSKTEQLIFDTLEEASQTYYSKDFRPKPTDIFPMPGSEVIREVHRKFWRKFAEVVAPH